MIDPAIKFFDKSNDEILEHIKSIPPENMYNKAPNEWAKKHLDGIAFKIGDEHIPMGVGGLHTTRPQGAWEGNIVEFDVTSYYPQLIMNMGRSPAGLSSAWLDEFKKPYEQRIDYKKQGNKAGADVMKIVINSVYGKLGQGTSINYDPSLQMSVTLNGQLFLLMLVEAFVKTDYELISANTDSVTVLIPPHREDATADIVEWWESVSNCTLETTEYTQYVSQSVNNYFAVTTNDEVKKKGFFLAESGSEPAIISKAVISHFTEQTPVKQTIENATSIFDFLYSANLKGSVKWNDKKLSKTNRWYTSSKGSVITVGDEKPRRVGNSDHAWVCNLVTSDSIPTDLIKDHYITEANKVIYGIENGLAAKSKNEGILKSQAQKYIDQGMHIVPKGRPDQPKANFPGKIPTKRIVVLKVLFEEWLVNWHDPIGMNPWTAEKIPQRPPRDYVLSDDELYALLQRLNKNQGMARDIVKLLLLTGLRRQEVSSASRQEFEGEQWRIPGERMKGERAHIVLLSKQAKVLVERILASHNSEWLFPSPRTTGPFAPEYGYKWLKQGDVKYTLHDLRRTFSSHLGESLVHDAVIDRVLAHAKLGIVRHYNHARLTDPARKAWQAWADYLDVVAKGKKK